MIETGVFREDLKPIVLHHGKGEDKDKEDTKDKEDLKPIVLPHNQENGDEEDMNDKDTKDYSINLAARELRCLQESQHIII